MKTRSTCRVCEKAVEPVLSLGEHYVSDFPAPADGDGTRAPLELVLCRRCHLLQLAHTVPPETMYRNYWYRSGTNQSMRDALSDITRKAQQLIHLRAGDSVLDIGCNDGTLLASYNIPGLYRIGFDPAENLAPLSRKVADTVVAGFFEAAAFRSRAELRSRRPRIVTSIAMFYDLEDPNRFVADVKEVMDADGVWVVQMSYLPLMLKQNAFDNICHEHLEYYSLRSFEYLLKLHELEVVAVELNDVNGGSFRVYIRNADTSPDVFADPTYRELAAQQVHRLREEESKSGIDDPATYRAFSLWVERIRSDLTSFIHEQAGRGKKVHVYGASTKGNTTLQYCGFDRKAIPAAAERNPDKWGRVTVGTRIPIISEEQSRGERPDYYLVLPWHFLEEFKRRELPFLSGGGRFIVPMPHFCLV